MAEQFEDQNTVYYRSYYQFPGRSRWMEKVWSEAFGDAYPAGLDHYGYLTGHDLEVMAGKLGGIGEGSVLLDMGCGKGGPGLWLAGRLGLRLIGVDIIAEAVEQAREFAGAFALKFPAQFEVGEFYRIPLPDASVDAVISIDSLWAAPNKIQALMEVKRVMKPGARFVFTHWDLLAVESVPALEMSGLKFVEREDTPDWKVYQQRVYEGILRYEGELVEEMGAGANMLLYEAKASPPYLDLSVRRIYVMEK
jgi:ubiquinone/menaquinone biosynthesis C-methylase UbiE